LKHYWSAALDELKHESCSVHTTFGLQQVNLDQASCLGLKKNALYKYKLAIKDTAVAFEQKFSDELMEYVFEKKT